jgi:superfamily II DNA or RNA helicase
VKFKVIKREALFIPIKDITPKQQSKLKEKLTFHFVASEKVCDKCEWAAERYNDVCERCANYSGAYELAKPVKVGERKYMKIPVGGGYRALRELGMTDYRVVDKSPDRPLKRPFKFKGSLKAGQREAIDSMHKSLRGILLAPPRSGKTVMGATFIAEFGQKTLILGSQRDWLMGFMETFIGSDTQPALTTLRKSQIKICKTLDDFKNHDVCLATVQTFYSEKGAKLLEKLRSMFGAILIDEVQTAAADKYMTILAKLNPAAAIGLSGTPDRKDKKDVLTANILGPIFYRMEVKRERPTIYLTRTRYTKLYKGQAMWARMVSSLENDKKRIEDIAKQALLDVKSGHMILIPMAQVKPVKALIAKINELAGKKLAFEFSGSMKKEDRDSYIQQAREYKIKILVGTQKVLSVGINIPRASMLYELVMSSNIPGAQQRFARVLTPMEGKPPPGIRFFLDDMNVRRNCMRNEYFNCLKPVFNPIISKETQAQLNAYLNQSSTNQANRFDL